MHTKEGKVDMSKALDSSLVETESSGTESKKQDTSIMSGNDIDADNVDIRFIYDEEPMAKVQLIVDNNVFAIGQQHTQQPEFSNEGKVEQNAKQCHDIRPLKHGQFLKDKSNEAKVKIDIDDYETINIELECSVATLPKEIKTLKKHYKELYDSIKTTRAKTIKYTTSLIAQKPLFEEYFTTSNQSVSKSFALSDNFKQQDTPTTTNIQPTTEPITPTTNVNVEENNNDQAADAQIDENKFYNIFSTSVREEAELSTRFVNNLNMYTFYQRHQSEHQWTKYHPLEQVCGNPSKPVQTRRQLATDLEMCVFALTLSTAEPKNIKEATAISAWIKAM
nr:hypothetical protein [Tanacetum cinerariifolium]